MPDITTAFGQFGTSLQLAQIDSYETDDSTLDENGDPNFLPTGRLNITMLNREGTRTGVPFAMSGGSSSFTGSLPEIGTTCIVGFFDQQDPVVLGFLPKGLNNLIGGRATVPNLQPGEVLMQAASSGADAEGNDQQFVGASVRLDNYGRIIITGNDYKLTIGYLLSNENTSDVTSMNDPITGEAIYLHEIGPGGTQRRVGAAGSTVWQYGKDKVERIGGNVDSRVEGQLVVIARAGQTYQDKRGNSFGIDTAGNVFVEASTGGYSMSSQGPLISEVGSFESYNTLWDYKRNVGGDHTTMIGGNRKVSVGNIAGIPNGESKIVMGVLGSSESIVAGAKLIAALAGITLFSGPVPPAGIPAAGVPGSIIITAIGPIIATAPSVLLGPAPTDPVVTLAKFQAFVTALIAVFNAGIAPPSGGAVAFATAGTLTAAGAAVGSATVLASP